MTSVCLKMILLGMVAALVLWQLFTLAQEYLLAFVAVRLDTGGARFFKPQTTFPADDYFNNGGQAIFQRRLEGATQVRQFAANKASAPCWQ